MTFYDTKVVKVVNFVEFHPLKSHLFPLLCGGNVGRPQVASLAFGGEVVMKGYFFKQLVELKDVCRFIQDSCCSVYQHF